MKTKFFEKKRKNKNYTSVTLIIKVYFLFYYLIHNIILKKHNLTLGIFINIIIIIIIKELKISFDVNNKIHIDSIYFLQIPTILLSLFFQLLCFMSTLIFKPKIQSQILLFAIELGFPKSHSFTAFLQFVLLL